MASFNFEFIQYRLNCLNPHPTRLILQQVFDRPISTKDAFRCYETPQVWLKYLWDGDVLGPKQPLAKKKTRTCSFDLILVIPLKI